MARVYLIGVGPGDEELITLKAVRLLKACDAVLYDRLSNDALLKYLRDDCEIFYCGKKPGNHYKTQDEINDTLVSLAKSGKTVGRIKGGDPYVFGRGGEEALRLFEENIDFEVVPGITSAISVLNYSGIPTTQRDMSQSFHVYIGKTSGKHNIDWKIVSRNEGTQIFLMGLGSLDEIVKNFIENGKPNTTPVAVIMKGTTSKQRKVVGTLENIVDKVNEAALESPCIIVIGDVVDLNEKLNWYEKKPLFGLNICTTRSKAQSRELNERILDLGAEVTEINTIKISETKKNLDPYVKKLKLYDYLVFTSVNAVELFFGRLCELDVDVREIKARVVVIGKKTHEMVKSRGIVPFSMSEHFVTESLFERMSEFVKRGDKVFIPQSSISRAFLKDKLTAMGCEVDTVAIYDTLKGDVLEREVLINSFRQVDIVIFTSPSTVRNLIEMIGIDSIKEKTIVSIGEITQGEVLKQGMTSTVCDEASTDGLIDKLIELKERLDV